mmetsp:Transcript_2018/g.6027  ORF Transcript_2018/g.6027 Transcript_2018/m.6027 type:complete len:209 (-) Transcript_2018:1067-1693(-)
MGECSESALPGECDALFRAVGQGGHTSRRCDTVLRVSLRDAGRARGGPVGARGDWCPRLAVLPGRPPPTRPVCRPALEPGERAGTAAWQPPAAPGSERRGGVCTAPPVPPPPHSPAGTELRPVPRRRPRWPRHCRAAGWRRRRRRATRPGRPPRPGGPPTPPGCPPRPSPPGPAWQTPPLPPPLLQWQMRPGSDDTAWRLCRRRLPPP